MQEQEYKLNAINGDIDIVCDDFNPEIDCLLEKHQYTDWACLIKVKNPTFDRLSKETLKKHISIIRNNATDSIIYEVDRILEYHGLLILNISKLDSINLCIELGYDAIYTGKKGEHAEFLPEILFENQIAIEEFRKMGEEERYSLLVQRTKSEESTKYDELLIEWWTKKKESGKEAFLKMTDQQRLSIYMKRIHSNEPSEFDGIVYQWWNSRY